MTGTGDARNGAGWRWEVALPPCPIDDVIVASLIGCILACSLTTRDRGKGCVSRLQAHFAISRKNGAPRSPRVPPSHSRPSLPSQLAGIPAGCPYSAESCCSISWRCCDPVFSDELVMG